MVFGVGFDAVEPVEDVEIDNEVVEAEIIDVVDKVDEVEGSDVNAGAGILR